MGINVLVCPSRYVIEGYSSISYLERLLGVWDKFAHKVKFRAMNIDGDVAIVPGGVELGQIFALKRADWKDMRSFFYEPRVVAMNLKVEPRGEHQEDAIQYLQGIGRHQFENQKMLCLGTGQGKTFCALAHIARTQHAAIIFIDQKNLSDQWDEKVTEYTDIGTKEIYRIVGVDKMEKIKEKNSHQKYKLYLASIQTFAAYGKKHGWHAVGEWLQEAGIGIKVYDEAHVEWQTMCMIDLWSDVRQTVYLTATPRRSNYTEDKVYQEIFCTIPKYGLGTKYRDKVHTIGYLSIDTDPDLVIQNRLKKARGFDVNGWCSWICLEQNFRTLMKPIEQVVFDMVHSNPGVKVAIIAHTIEMVDKIHASLLDFFPMRRDIVIARYHGKVVKTEKENALKADIMITTEKSFGKGMDRTDLEVMICTVPFSSPVVAEQLKGRLRGESGKHAIYIDVRDSGFDSCERMWRERKPVLEASAEQVFNLELEE
jgi:superfamily II DNA or RNA helicase